MTLSKKSKTIIFILTAVITALCIGTGIILGCVVFRKNKPEPVPAKYRNDWDPSMTFDLNQCSRVVIPADEDVRILQLTDIHYDMNNNKKEQTLSLIKNTIEQADPHIITLTGDWSSQRKGTLELAKQVFDLLEESGVPWAPVFGNHDMEGDLSRYDYADIFAGYKNCLFKTGYTNIGGVGNYIVNIMRDNAGQEYVGSLFMLDSDTSTRINVQKYIGLNSRQVEWYKWAVDSLNALYSSDGKPVRSIMYMHVPLSEYAMTETSQAILGVNEEKCCVPEKNTGMFDAIKEKGSTIAVFCGHDHMNNAVISYEGVLLGYGVESGWCKGYAENSAKGGTLVTADKNFSISVSHVLFQYS